MLGPTERTRDLIKEISDFGCLKSEECQTFVESAVGSCCWNWIFRDDPIPIVTFKQTGPFGCLPPVSHFARVLGNSAGSARFRHRGSAECLGRDQRRGLVGGGHRGVGGSHPSALPGRRWRPDPWLWIGGSARISELGEVGEGCGISSRSDVREVSFWNKTTHGAGRKTKGETIQRI